LTAFARVILNDQDAAKDLVQEAASRALAARRVQMTRLPTGLGCSSHPQCELTNTRRHVDRGRSAAADAVHQIGLR
jgi:hypothetical protein